MNDLELHANHMRQNIIKMVHEAKCGHPGGSLSATDILIEIYFRQMHICEENLYTYKRDRFVLSKGHAAPALYAVLAEKGLLPEEDLLTLRKLDSMLQGHPNMNYVAGVDMTTGSLGQGISAAVGMAMANKLDKVDYRIYAMLGDGEIQEGQVWEAAMAASHYKLDNLCAVVDNNNLQIDGDIRKVMNPTPIDEKFKAFGWHVINVDGHNFDELHAAFEEAKTIKGKPTCIVAHTIKGKGVSFMENNAGWHGKAPNDAEFEVAMNDLGGTN